MNFYLRMFIVVLGAAVWNGAIVVALASLVAPFAGYVWAALTVACSLYWLRTISRYSL